MISTVRDLVADALFASSLQPSDDPTPDLIRATVTATILRLGSDGCAFWVAQEFGDHPEIAVRRMQWARQQTDESYTATVSI